MEKRTEKGYQKKIQYIREYEKQKYKRIPLNVTLDKYEEIKTAAATSGESINGYIKKAIDKRLAEGE